VRGYSAIDAARNQLATDALARGYQELMWIDSDIVFHPDDVQKLRSHNLPFACGLYAKKGPRQFACEFLPGTTSVKFGKHGGLVEVRYCGFGFTLVRREVFETVRTQLDLPECNQRFGKPLVPYFQPLVVPDPPLGPRASGPRAGETPALPGQGGNWSLSEDYSFCERSRRAGFAVMADTTIRLWHVGMYHYGWEDAGSSKDRYGKYVFEIVPPAEGETRRSE
jgi:hypothetical protein